MHKLTSIDLQALAAVNRFNKQTGELQVVGNVCVQMYAVEYTLCSPHRLKLFVLFRCAPINNRKEAIK